MIAYRKDVDGLRAVAIVSVVLFHAFPEFVPGGFIGVDIFFVISGFLITSILFAELNSNQFSILDFWVRRCRRIIPALFFLLAVVTLAAFVLLLPDDLNQYGGMLAAAASFFANIHLGQDRGYFDPAFLDNPLLHVWSLAVEEQYYVVWPMLFALLFARLNRKYLLPCLFAILLCSLAYSQWAAIHAPLTAFFSLPSRAFELLIGASLAVASPGAIRSRPLADLLAFCGVLLIGAGLFALNEKTKFPGLAALLPCLGAALLVRSGAGETQTAVKWLLASRPFVGIGRISYSWYLWHWPPLAFAHYYFGRPLGDAETLGLIAFGLAAGIFSWRVIETPFRRQMPRVIFIRRALPAMAAILVAFLALGASFIVYDGMRWRLSPEAQVAQELFTRLKHKGSCGGKDSGYLRECVFGSDTAKAPSLLLWGDSHAGHYLAAVAKIAAAYDLKGIAQISPGCQPLVAPSFYNIKHARRPKCRRSNEKALAKLRARPEIQTVLLAGRWSSQYEPSTVAADLARLTKDIEKTVQTLRAMGKNVVILGEVPRLKNDLKACTLKQIAFGVNIPNCGFVSSANVDALETAIWSALQEMQDRRGDMIVFAAHRHLCDASRCSAFDAAGKPLYSDNNHLNIEGSDFLEPFLRQAMQPVLHRAKPQLGDAQPPAVRF